MEAQPSVGNHEPSLIESLMKPTLPGAMEVIKNFLLEHGIEICNEEQLRDKADWKQMCIILSNCPTNRSSANLIRIFTEILDKVCNLRLSDIWKKIREAPGTAIGAVIDAFTPSGTPVLIKCLTQLLEAKAIKITSPFPIEDLVSKLFGDIYKHWFDPDLAKELRITSDTDIRQLHVPSSITKAIDAKSSGYASTTGAMIAHANEIYKQKGSGFSLLESLLVFGKGELLDEYIKSLNLEESKLDCVSKNIEPTEEEKKELQKVCSNVWFREKGCCLLGNDDEDKYRAIWRALHQYIDFKKMAEDEVRAAAVFRTVYNSLFTTESNRGKVAAAIDELKQYGYIKKEAANADLNNLLVEASYIARLPPFLADYLQTHEIMIQPVKDTRKGLIGAVSGLFTSAYHGMRRGLGLTKTKSSTNEIIDTLNKVLDSGSPSDIIAFISKYRDIFISSSYGNRRSLKDDQLLGLVLCMKNIQALQTKNVAELSNADGDNARPAMTNDQIGTL